MRDDIFTDMLEDDYEPTQPAGGEPDTMANSILAESIERVRLAAGNNQFTIRLCGELATICHLALESDARQALAGKEEA